MHYTSVEADFGKLGLVATSKGLVAIDFINCDIKEFGEIIRHRFTNYKVIINGEYINGPCEQIKEYLQGKRKKFSLDLDLQGTDFQKKVWQELMAIPYGQTCSYQDIANRLNKSKAVRAVGQANGRNPIAIVIPCHRVINKAGTLGGYSSGIEIKKWLLDWEAANDA